MADFDPSGDRTDAIMLYLLTGSHQHEVMKDWVEKPRLNDDDYLLNDDKEDAAVDKEAGKDGQSKVFDASIQGGETNEPFL